MGKDIIMAKGSESKSIFYAKILEIFENSFVYNNGKEVRIPFQEDGKDIQLKIVVTCAKDNVEPGEDQAIPGAKVVVKEGTEPAFKSATEEEIVEPTKEELDTVSSMMAAMANLGF